MAHLKKLSAFRQLSLGCDGTEQRRRSFKKQFSEDLADSRIGIKITLNSNARNLISAPPIKIAWGEDPVIKTDEAVIIKKCRENARISSGKLSRQSSLEKNSILHSKQDITERLQEKEQEKPNLRIFLAQNTKEHHLEELDKLDQPKIIPPLLNNVSNRFQIRRSPKSNPNETTTIPINTTNTVVVVPIVEPTTTPGVKPIDSVVIRPATAAIRRDHFQKRTSSAFHATIKEPTNHARPTLVRSSSAPSKPDHNRSKFTVTKRKIKATKRTQSRCVVEDNDHSPKNHNGVDVVTMVSLVSPAGSDCDEETLEIQPKEKEKCRSPKKTPKTEKDVPKILSLRKTVKSVSFQQSSIHAVRSFSASFPGRRASVAAAAMTMSSNASKTIVTTPAPPSKSQEKRGSITAMPDDDERTPKRKLLSDERKTVSCDKPEHGEFNDCSSNRDENKTEPRISVDIKEKSDIATPGIGCSDSESRLDDDQGTQVQETNKYESPKEKQCWNMYCKMMQKGINVSFDTILRGMLTPTEYRLSRKKVDGVPNDDAQNFACETK